VGITLRHIVTGIAIQALGQAKFTLIVDLPSAVKVNLHQVLLIRTLKVLRFQESIMNAEPLLEMEPLPPHRFREAMPIVLAVAAQSTVVSKPKYQLTKEPYLKPYTTEPVEIIGQTTVDGKIILNLVTALLCQELSAVGMV
jgi:hypothetical protein